MKPKHRIFAQRLGQGVLVVLSILVAFGLDALWEESKERRDLHDDLANISSELEENRARVEYHLDMARRMVDAFDVTLAAIESNQAAPAVPDTTFWLTSITPSLDASLGAIEALVASGRMAVIGNPDLSRRLAGLRDRVEDAVEEQTQAWEVQVSLVLPYLEEHDWQAVRHLDDVWAQERIPGRQLENRGNVALPSGRSLVPGLNVRRTLHYVTIGEFRALLQEFDVIEELIDSEVGGS